MGSGPSKKIEETLETSSSFRVAVDASFEECMVLSQHIFAGLQAYQLLDAAIRVYEKIASIDEEDDIVTRYKDKWLPRAPTQVDVDRGIEKEKFFNEGRQVLSLEEFRTFATTLFRDMGLTNACHKLVVYVPAGSIGVLCAHALIKRLPLLGPMYRAAGPLMPGLLLGSVIGVLVSQLQI